MDRQWEPFYIGDIFSFIGRGKRIVNANHIGGDTPLVSSMGDNNGVTNFVGNTEDVRIFNDCLTVANGGASAGRTYYQPFAFVGADHVTQCKQDGFSSDRYLMLAQTMSNALMGKYSFSHEIKDKTLGRERVLLPVTDSGEPDWEYMEQMVKTTRVGLIARYKAYVRFQLSKLKFNAVPDTKDVEWGQFRIGSLFTVKRPKARNKDDYDFGDIPFVASGAMNNGVMKCCSPKLGETLDQGGCITVSPVDGSSFYQPIDFLGRGGAGSSVLMLYSKAINAYSGHFVAKMIAQTCSKYTYGHMGNKDSIKRETVMLPVAPSGEPDWDYMEQYAKNLMKRKYEQYLAYLDGQAE